MKRLMPLIAAAVLLAAMPLKAQDAVSKMMADAIVKGPSVVLVTFSYQISPELESRFMTGQGLCIDKSGLFVTYAMDTRIRAEHIKNVRIIVPGNEPKLLKGEFLWSDQEIGVAFVRTREKAQWVPAVFDRDAKVSVGSPVVSIGITTSVPSQTVAAAPAYVSALLRVPERVFVVAGGKLTSPCSPVMGQGGAVIGMVIPQPPVPSTVMTNQGATEAMIGVRTESSVFRPAADIAHVLDYAIKNPDKPRQYAWLGALGFMGLAKDSIQAQGLKTPGVMISNLVPTSEGARAGLKNEDIIVAVNGKTLEPLATPEYVSISLQRDIGRMPMGSQVDLTIVRGGKEQPVKVSLRPFPARPQDAPQWVNYRLGLIGREKVELDKYLKTPSGNTPGLLVTEVIPRSPSADGGLRPNDLITQVNGQEVSTVAAVRKIVDQALKDKPDQIINFVITRDNQAQNVPITPPAMR